MKTKQIILPLIFVTALPAAGWSQQLEEVTVAASAVVPQGDNGGALIWTLGELMTELYGSGSALDQGFLQYQFLDTPVEEPSLGWNLEFWPNPVSHSLLNVRADESLQITIVDARGRQLTGSTFAESAQFNLLSWPSGAYWLVAEDRRGRRQAFPLVKL